LILVSTHGIDYVCPKEKRGVSQRTLDPDRTCNILVRPHGIEPVLVSTRASSDDRIGEIPHSTATASYCGLVHEQSPLKGEAPSVSDVIRIHSGKIPSARLRPCYLERIDDPSRSASEQANSLVIRSPALQVIPGTVCRTVIHNNHLKVIEGLSD
tara:strand:- start:57 stop:521 length:465 start_codon:yes stop_codon:yes gene_type:complete